MARMYFEIARGSRSGVWAILENEKPLAFVAGCADVRACYRSVVLRGFVPLSFQVFLALRSPAVWRKLPAVMLYPFRRNESPAKAPPRHISAELLAIAVDEEARGKGLGKMLVHAFERGLAEWEVGEYRVTTNTQEIASNHFYRRLGFEACGTLRHHDLELQQYSKSVRSSDTLGA